MKIIDRKTFLDLPPGTVFAKYEPCCFGGLEIKEGSLIYEGGSGGDFVTQGLGVEIECSGSEDFQVQCEKAEKGEEIPLDFYCAGRDGLFEQDQLFAVLSKKDIKDLIKRLEECL